MYLQTRAKPSKTVRWEPWPYQIDLLNLFLTETNLVILKARQLGISWLVAAYALWMTVFNDSAKVLFLSQGEKEAWDMVAKARFIWDKLPPYMKLSLENDTRSWITFKANGSEISALASTDKAGRGTDATVVVRDELAYHPYGEDNFAAISPTIDSGGQSIDLSTINKLDTSNHFTERVQLAKNGAKRTDYHSGLVKFSGGESGVTLVFLGWNLRPVRRIGMTLDEWFETEVRHKYTPLKIEQEYPKSIEEALKPSTTRAFFDAKSVDDMMMQLCQPLKDFKEFDTYNGKIRVYKPPVIGRKYCVFSDPSNGIEDPFVTVVMDVSTGEIVASATGRIPAQEVARIHDTLSRAYNNAYHTGEVNAQAGGSFIDTIVSLETPNMAPRRSPDGKVQHGKVGWQTNMQLRDKSLHDLEGAILRSLVTVHDREAIEEMKNFVLDDDGKLKASGQGHDDWVMALAGVWQIAKWMPRTESGFFTGKYRG